MNIGKYTFFCLYIFSVREVLKITNREILNRVKIYFVV